MDMVQMKEELNLLMTDLDGLTQGTPEFISKMDAIEASQLKIKDSAAQDKRLADILQVNESLSSFRAPVTAQAGPVASIIVRDGFTSDPKKGFQSAGEFLSQIAKCTVQGTSAINYSLDPRLAHAMENQDKHLMTSGGHNTTVDGLMIPAELDPTINVIGKNASMDWLSRINTKQTSSNSVEIRTSKAATRGGTVGLVANWEGEGNQLTSSRNVYSKTTTKLSKLYVYSDVTEEDLADFALLESDLMQTAPEVMRIKKAEAVLFGDGVQKPLGFTNGGDLASVARTTSSLFKSEDAANMHARFLGDINDGFWMMNQMLRAQLPQLNVGDQPVYQSDFRAAPGGLLFGMPIFWSEDCEALGDLGDVNLVNGKAYSLYEKVGGAKFASSMHVLFDFDKMAFRWTERVAGSPIFDNPYTPRDNDSKNSNKDTLSNFVTLQA